ncbi:MAG: DUF2079 domain-containing protein [Elusimicrobiota bacterium]|nr:DUF2079 domain-containing protein [Elusimicrobiota bacterium]
MTPHAAALRRAFERARARWRPLARRWRATDAEARVLTALGALYGLVFGFLAVLQLRALFSFEYEDAALESQLLYNLATSGRFVQTLFFDGGHDHFWPIAYLLAPFYWIHPGLETWFFLRGAAYGLCALPLYLVARDRLDSKRTALLLGLSWLAYAPLQYLALGTVDGGRNFVLPFLVLAVFFLERRRFAPFIASVLLVCACKEDMPLVGLGLAAYAAWRGLPARWWKTTAAVCLGYLALSRVFLATTAKPWPRDDGAMGGLYYLDAANAGRFIGMLLGDWRETLGYLLHPSKVKALFLLGWPLLFLPLFAVELLVPASAFAVFLLARPRFYNQNGDYLAPILPFLFLALCAALVKLKALRGERTARAAAALVLALCLLQQGTRTLLGCAAEENETPGRADDPAFAGVRRILDPRLYRADDDARRALALVRRIPREASVTASGSLLPLLSARRELHEFGAYHGVPLKERKAREARYYSADVVLLDRRCRSHGLGGGYACVDPDDFERELRKLVGGYRYKLLVDDGVFVLLSTPLGRRFPAPRA